MICATHELHAEGPAFSLGICEALEKIILVPGEETSQDVASGVGRVTCSPSKISLECDIDKRLNGCRVLAV